MAPTIKTKKEIAALREGGRILAAILARVAEEAQPGASAAFLDARADELIRAAGGVPSFKGYRPKGALPYPSAMCISINSEVVHAIPRADKIFRTGDVVALDIGMQWPHHDKAIRGLFTDMAVTIGIGDISKDAKRLITATRDALQKGIAAVRAGARVGDISAAVQKHLDSQKLGIVRDLAGHGVGYAVHEEPFIPNWGRAGSGAELREGMVIAIEPIANLGSERVVLERDGWTYSTADKSLSAHFEHTLAVTKRGAEVLTIL